MSSTIVHSGTNGNLGPRYAYDYTYDSSVVSDKKKAAIVILFVVGTNMKANAYKDLAAKCVTGQSIVFVTVDNNPRVAIKLDGKQTADAFNDIAANATERLGDFVSSSPAIFVGGHSAGGFSAIAAMKVNGGDLNFEPAGFIGADPFGRTNINTLKINCPTFAIGFTNETCQVKLLDAGLAAYNVTTSSNRVMMQIQNPADRGNQITHCIFSEDGCGAICPSHEAGAWVRQVIGNFATLFVNSIVKGVNTAKGQYENATGDNKSDVNVFYGTETATV